MAKPILISGVQPTGRMHLGNYLGALKNFVDLQNSGKYECYFCVVDLHSLTLDDFDPKQKSAQILNLTADFLALGLDPKRSVIFQQSQVPAHSELAWILNTITPFGELKRMTQFKDKSKAIWDHLDKKHGRKNYSDEVSDELADELVEGATNVGLFNYPVLMAADILLYDAKVVPVGEDQIQHLELTRTLARKFNKKFGRTFVEPQPLLTPASRVMSLQNPDKKMSKSQPDSCLFLDDEPEAVREKVKRAVTDSGSEVRYDEKNKPAISNLLDIFSAMAGHGIPVLEKKYAGKKYSEFKSDLAETIVEKLAPYREKKKKLLAKPSELKKALSAGSAKAGKRAKAKMAEVKEKVGLTL